jgi:hypothetical protein
VCDGNGNCVNTHCTDGIKDGDETDVDCGGSCGPCADGKECLVGADCKNKVCPIPEGGANGICALPSCNDGVQNGNETDTDCGGTGYALGSDAGSLPPCSPCADTKKCDGNTDCVSINCISNVCTAKANGVQCSSNAECGTNNACVTDDTNTNNKICCATSCTDQGSTSCGTDGNCKHDGSACADYAASTPCGSASCNGATYTPAVNCNGSGTCATPSTTNCANSSQVCNSSKGCVQCNTGPDCPTSCSGGMLTTSTCNASNACVAGSPAQCAGNFICANATSCKTACSADADCVNGFFCKNPGASGTCVGKNAAGGSCSANDQCSSGLCGPSGTTGTHCCAAGTTCSATVSACGATDCNTSGACLYPGTTVAPASLQGGLAGTCQEEVCNGSGGDSLVADPTNIPGPSGSACLINPHCNGNVPSYDQAAAGTPCTTASDPAATVCGDPAGMNGGECVECNTDTDCLAVQSDGGTLVCNTSSGICLGCVTTGGTVVSTSQCASDCCNQACTAVDGGGSTTCQ